MVSRTLIAVAISFAPAVNRSWAWGGRKVGVTVGKLALGVLDRRRALADGARLV